MFDNYEIRARYIPTIIAAVPIMIFSGFIKQDIWLSLFQNADWFLAVENMSLSLIFIVLLINLQRGIAKHGFEARVFNSGKDFPTTTLLLHSDTFLSKEAKSAYRKKIESEFNLHLLSEKEEAASLDEAKKTLRDAVNLVRKRVKDGNKTLQYNIHYGFFRNLIGGAVLATPVAIFNSIVFGRNNDSAGLWISGAIALAFLTLIIFNKLILKHFGRAYAECLLSEYLAMNKGDKNAQG